MPPRYLGKLEGLARGKLLGWAWDGEAKVAPAVRLEIEGRVVAEFTPDKPLPAMAKAGPVEGRVGFAWAVPPEHADPGPQRLRLLAAADGSVIFEHPAARLADAAEELFRAWKQEALGQGFWALESLAETAGTLSGTGWAVPPHGRPQPLRLLVDGTPARMTWLRRPAPEITDGLGLTGRFAAPRFRFTLPAPAAALRHFALADARGRVLAPGQELWVSAAAVPTPPEPLRRRAHPAADAAGFDRGGSSAAQLLTRALARHVPGGFGKLGTVVDWGCGCARVGRYLLPLLGRRYLGIDPDAEAIAWCRQALPEARFEVMEAEPPLAFGSGTVDAAIGLGILPRLDPALVEAWLAELARVLRPGGVVALSSLGKAAWFGNGRRPEDFLRWRRQGWARLGSPGHGRSTVIGHALEYLQARLGQYFQVLEAQDGGMGGYEDLIIARRQG